MRTTRLAAAALVVLAVACSSSSQSAQTSVGACCPVDDVTTFDGCAGTHKPGGWATSANECADPNVAWGAGSYLVARTDVHGCAVFVDVVGGEGSGKTCAGPPPASASPIGGGVCCPLSGTFGCEGTRGGAGGWAPHASTCPSADFTEDLYLVTANDVHGCAIMVNDATVCACECQPDASAADAGRAD